MWEEEREPGWGWGGVAVIVSLFPEGGDVYLLSLPVHLHVKKLQFLCGQDLSGLHFLLDRAECGVRTPGRGESNFQPPSLSSFYKTVPSLIQSTGEARVGFLRRRAEWWRVAEGRSTRSGPGAWAARHAAHGSAARAPPQVQRQFPA